MGKPKKGDWIVTTEYARSFIRSQAATPGTQVELSDGRRVLIGNVNSIGGICDCCEAFSEHDMVVAYRRLL